MNVMKEKILQILIIFILKLADIADEVVFVSEWLRSIYVNLGMSKNKTKVIMSGSNKNIFKDYQNKLNNIKLIL